MLKLLLSFGLFISSQALAQFDDALIECTNGQNSVHIQHEDDVDGRGVYNLEVKNMDGEVSSFHASSFEYFEMLDAIWNKGIISFENASSQSVFSLEGSPFVKRMGMLTSESVPEVMQCQIKASLPTVSCETTRVIGKPSYIVHFRHGTDMGTTTGYYISRIFTFSAAEEEFDFTMEQTGAFGLNKVLTKAAFQKGSPIDFRFTSGAAIRLDDWKSKIEFNGRTDLSGEVEPIRCSLLSE